MLDFAPTEEQQEIQRLAHTLAVEQLRPHGRSAEKRGDISLELLHTLLQTGITTPFPEAYGGSGEIDALTYTLIAEELGFGDGALALNIVGSLMGPLTVLFAGDDIQQGHIITPFTDEREGYMRFGSLAVAEAGSGYALAEISTTARREGDTYILNGAKRDVIHGEHGHPRVALARLEGTKGLDGLCAFLIPHIPHGMRVRFQTQKLGLMAAPSASFTFENAAIPASDMLGAPGATNTNGALRAATLYSILRAAIACGMTRAALEYAMDYARQRVAFGRPIVSYQGIAFIIAETAMKLDAARLLTWRAAASWDQQVAGEQLALEAGAAHTQAVKLAKAATLDAIQVMGGAGFIQDHPVEMWARNAAAWQD